MTTLYLDTESFSECDLKTAGTHAYAAHPSTEITVAQWATGDGDPRVHDCTLNKPGFYPGELHALFTDPAVVIVAHNSAFDRAVIRHVWGIDIPVERWHDTMVQAMAHGLPGSLEKVGMILGAPLDEQKDKRGKQLIRLFCKPLPKNNKLRRATRETHPAEWAEFLEYSRQDIVAMRAIHKKLPEWNYRHVTGTAGHRELQLWQLDQKINDRGFAVDVDLATRALATAERCRADLREQVQEATEGQVSSATKRDQMLAYLLAEYGVTLPDMAADTLKRRMDDPVLPEGVKLLLAIRLEASMASSSKYKALLAAVSSDARLRNTMQFAGAQRTARWAGRIFQPQNMKRPDPDMTGEVVAELTEAAKSDVLDLVHSEPMRALANLVRGCIVAPADKKLVIADLSNIEGRMLAWLAGESWKLTAFADFDAGKGADLYRVAYGRAFNIDPHTVDKNQRQIGKVQELGLGYQGGVGAFLTFAAVYNMDLDQLARAVQATASGAALHEAGRMYDWTVKKNRSTFGLPRDTWIACQVLVTAWREAHSNVVGLWTSAEAAMHMALLHPGTPHRVGEHIRVQRDGAWTRVRLPSGRCLCYLNNDGQLTYAGVNQYTRQWGRIKTYGGKLVENWTQAAARDVLGHNMPEVERQGYEIVLSVHDELLTETPDSDAFNCDTLAAIMATNPPWASGLPLAAAGFETYRYRKD
jgi:DNA polymerase